MDEFISFCKFVVDGDCLSDLLKEFIDFRLNNIIRKITLSNAYEDNQFYISSATYESDDNDDDDYRNSDDELFLSTKQADDDTFNIIRM